RHPGLQQAGARRPRRREANLPGARGSEQACRGGGGRRPDAEHRQGRVAGGLRRHQGVRQLPGHRAHLLGSHVQGLPVFDPRLRRQPARAPGPMPGAGRGGAVQRVRRPHGGLPAAVAGRAGPAGGHRCDVVVAVAHAQHAPVRAVGRALLQCALEMIGAAAQARFGRQFQKLAAHIESVYIPGLQAVKASGEDMDRLRASLSRLRLWLESFRASGRAPEPEGGGAWTRPRRQS
ncbi:unnamed protein product, partial [Prorocentrum cordatum]